MRAIRFLYSDAVTGTLYLATANIAVALPFAIGIQWRNVKKVLMQKQRPGKACSYIMSEMTYWGVVLVRVV